MTIDPSAVARVVGISTEYKDLRAGGVLFLEQRIAVFAQGRSSVSYSTSKFRATSAGQVGATLGYGSPAHLIARELFPVNGDGVGTLPVTFYPLVDGYDSAHAVGSITPSGTQTKAAAYRVRVNGILSEAFTIAVSATVAERCTSITAAINAVLEMPVVATNNTTNVGLQAKAAGPWGNGIVVEVLGDSLGTIFAIIQPTGGLVNPDITDALAQVGNIWETMAINALDIADEDILDEFQAFGEGRWLELVRKPLVVFTGNTAETVGAATAITSTRTDDRVNAQIPNEGSVNLPFVVAARAVARIAVLASANPPHDYGSQRLTGLLPGDDSVQWNYAQRDQAVKAGSSTVEVKDGVVNISDVVTMYAPTGEQPPAYRYVVDIVKLQNIIFNLDLIFATPEWDGAPLIPDDQATVNKTAKKPKMAVAAACAVIDSLGLNAIISDPKTAKKNTTANISTVNPKRWDLSTTVQLAGNSNIRGVELKFGFFFGSPTVVA